MTSTTFILLLIGSGVVALVGVIIVAMRRSESEGAATAAEFDRKAMKVDKVRREAIAQALVEPDGGASVATMVAAPAEYKDDNPREVVSATEYGVSRRKFFNRALSAVFGLFMLQFTLAGLAFFWPKLKGGFGTPINAGKAIELKAEVLVAGSIIPKFVPSAQAWIVPFDMNELAGSSFETVPFVVAGGESDGIGLMALWQRCVHLGCRVPSCESSQGFECPCHGSKYNGHGEYAQGPAPRNLDRFEVQVDAAGDLIVETGNIVQTSRSKNFTVAYPQGPFCV
ncbi:MAG: Rieske 2Fe-2S domain-containing protein [Actinomycetota bacterium]|nr:Rieske 2Fe-2S domain-containing protein [Actinomycetota bacterium]